MAGFFPREPIAQPTKTRTWLPCCLAIWKPPRWLGHSYSTKMDVHLCMVFSIWKRMWILPVDLHLIWGKNLILWAKCYPAGVDLFIQSKWPRFFFQFSKENVTINQIHLYIHQIRDVSFFYLPKFFTKKKNGTWNDFASFRQKDNSDKATLTKFTFANYFGWNCAPEAWAWNILFLYSCS